jgi:hypothetical protein
LRRHRETIGIIPNKARQRPDLGWLTDPLVEAFPDENECGTLNQSPESAGQEPLLPV